MFSHRTYTAKVNKKTYQNLLMVDMIFTRYLDYMVLMVQSEKKLKELLGKVVKESKKEELTNN